MQASPPKCSKRWRHKQINIQAISTSEIKISVLLGAAHTEAAVKTLHSLFGLDRT